MFQDSVAELPSLWASMNTWFTPTVFFVLLNLMIGTIALTSTLANQNKHHSQTDTSISQDHTLKLARSPSLLQRVRSINFYGYKQELQQPSLGSRTVVTSDANHFVTPAESNSFFTFEDTQNSKMLESPSQYIFEDAQKEILSQESNNGFDYFQQHHQENSEVMNTQYEFEQTHKEIVPESSNNLYSYFQQHHQENSEVLNTQYDFEQPQDSSTENSDDNAFGKSGSHHLNQENIEEQEAEQEEYGDELQSLEEVYSKVTGHHVSRTRSDTLPSPDEVPRKLTRKMRKSASVKSAFGHFEEESSVEIRRPATVRERGVAKVEEPYEEVDAKADDFINKFKQQLKLQRIDSITRYKEMKTRGSAK